MEKSIDMFGDICEAIGLSDIDADTYSPLTLAYIGDAVYEVVIRTMVVDMANMQVNKLHKKSSSLVKAKTQARIIRLLEDELDEKEMSVFKRGRNAKSFTKAKNVSVTDYRIATGFEALVGYLYLAHRTDRMLQLIKTGLDRMENEKCDMKN